MADESCSTCRFFEDDDPYSRVCHRHAPIPFNAIKWCELDIIRDIASAILEKIDIPERWAEADMNKEATEIASYAVWPTVDPSDWCGEWEPSIAKAAAL
jgi:hypothetical protein